MSGIATVGTVYDRAHSRIEESRMVIECVNKFELGDCRAVYDRPRCLNLRLCARLQTAPTVAIPIRSRVLRSKSHAFAAFAWDGTHLAMSCIHVSVGCGSPSEAIPFPSIELPKFPLVSPAIQVPQTTSSGIAAFMNSAAEQSVKKRFAGRDIEFERYGGFRIYCLSFNDSAGIVHNKTARGIDSDNFSGGIARGAQNWRAFFGTMGIRCNEVNAAMFKQDVDARFCRSAKPARHAHCRHLNQNSLGNEIRNNRRPALDFDVAFGMDQYRIYTKRAKLLQPFRRASWDRQRWKFHQYVVLAIERGNPGCSHLVGNIDGEMNFVARKYSESSSDRALKFLHTSFHVLSQWISRKSVEHVGRTYHLLNPVRRGDFCHLQRFGKRTRTVVNSWKNVRMDVYHWRISLGPGHQTQIRNCDVRRRGTRTGYLWLTGTHFRSGAGPRYSARGRISRLLEYCSRMWAVHPDIRLTAKNGVNISIGMPIT